MSTRSKMFIKSVEAFRKRKVLIDRLLSCIKESPDIEKNYPEIFKLAQEIEEALKY